MYKQGQLCYTYKDVVRSIYNKYGFTLEFTYKDLVSLVSDYNMSVHRKLLADGIYIKCNKRPHSDGIWRLMLSRDVTLYE